MRKSHPHTTYKDTTYTHTTHTHTHNDIIALSCKCSANAGTFYHCTNRSIALFYKCRNLSIEPFFYQSRSPLHVTNAVSYKMQEPAPFFTLYTHNCTKYHTHAHMRTHTIHNTQAASSPFHLVTSEERAFMSFAHSLSKNLRVLRTR